MPLRFARVVVVAVTWLLCGPAPGQGVEISPGVMLHFATAEETGKLLGTEDEYAKAMTPFDRGWFLKTDKPVSIREYLDFASRQGLDWTGQEIAHWTTVVGRVRALVAPLKLPLPPTVVLAKTTGREMDGASYTRGNAVVLPGSSARDAKINVLAHELFHVMTRHNPALRDALHAIIGFTPCEPVEVPPELAASQITNPDSPVIRHATHVRIDGEDVQAVAVIYLAAPAQRDGAGPFFSYLEWRLMAVEPTPRGLAARRDADGRLMLYKPEELPDYMARTGRNTGYIIQPEEILADNFVLMLGRRRVPDPAIPARMRQVLSGWSKGAATVPTSTSAPASAPASRKAA